MFLGLEFYCIFDMFCFDIVVVIKVEFLIVIMDFFLLLKWKYEVVDGLL